MKRPARDADSSSDALMVGKRIGQYRVVDRLGNGGMGAVYRAVDELLDRPVALKILEAEIDGSSSRFRAEAAALARLNHPGIATLYELIEDDGRLVMVMELVKGQTLHQVVEQIGVLSPQRAAELCMQALEALAHAHAAGVVHRDLKPANLMLTESGTIKILDFGIARLDGAVHLTRVGSMMGTPAYMAPEQVLGTVIDARADLYAMGVVFYRLITAQLPFRGDTPFDMAQAQVKDDPTPVNLVRPELPSWASEIITRALAKPVEQRFQSAMEFHEALAQCLASSTRVPGISTAEPTEVMTRPPLPAEPPQVAMKVSTAHSAATSRATSHRRSWGSWIGIAAALVIAGVAVWVFIPSTETKSETRVEPPVADSQPTAPAPALDPPAATPVVSLTTVPQPARGASSTPRTPTNAEPPTDTAAAPATFKNVKLLTVSGTSTTAKDAMLTLSSTELTAAPGAGSDPLATLPYRQVAKATYVHARDPVWDPAFAAPGGKINVPGILGRSRHWLVVQTPTTYAILRLDGDDRLDLLKTLEGRAGLTIERPSKDK